MKTTRDSEKMRRTRRRTPYHSKMVQNVNNDGIFSALMPRGFLPWIGAALGMAVIQAIPDAATWLRYDRAAIVGGELWRMLTANFIHLGWEHLALNCAGLLAIGWLFAEDYSLRGWTIVLIACSLATSAGLLLFNPEIDWCVGMSGALHGLFVAGALAWVGDGVHLGYGLLVGVAAKLGYEQFVGAMPFSEGVIGGIVVTDAHLWGAVGGLAIGVILLVWRRRGSQL